MKRIRITTVLLILLNLGLATGVYFTWARGQARVAEPSTLGAPPLALPDLAVLNSTPMASVDVTTLRNQAVFYASRAFYQPPPPPTEIPAPDYEMAGTLRLTDGKRIAFVKKKADRSSRTLHVGDDLDGWRVHVIEPDRITIDHGEQTAELRGAGVSVAGLIRGGAAAPRAPMSGIHVLGGVGSAASSTAGQRLSTEPRSIPAAAPFGEQVRIPLKMRPCSNFIVTLLVSLALPGCSAPMRVDAPGHTKQDPKQSSSPQTTVPLPETTPTSAPARTNALYLGRGQLTANPAGQTAPSAAPGATSATTETAAPPASQPATVQNGIQLAFADVDVAQIVGSVLGEALGLNYSIDPSVKGTMSLRSTRPLSTEELLPALEAALRTQDLALVKVKDTYNVVALKDAPRRVTSLNPSSDRHQPGFAVEIVPLQYTSAPEMEKVLLPFAPSGGVMKVDEARNLLVLAGTSQELASMLDIIKTFDVDWLAGMSYGFFNLNYVDAKTVETELSAIFADPKSPLGGVIRLVPLPRLNSILVITPQPKYLQNVETWIKRLDLGGTSAGRRIYVYDVQNGRAEDLARSLSQILSLPTGTGDFSSTARGFSSASSGGQFGFSGGGGGGSSLGSGLGTGSSGSFGSGLSSNMGTNGSWGNGGFANQGSAPSYSNGAAASGSAGTPGKSGDLRIVANNDSNSLMILATPAEFSVIEAALQRLDIPSRQVLIEASLAEITLTDELRYGVQWSFAGKNGPVTFSDTGKIAQKFPGLSFLFTGSTNISAVLNALEAITKVRVISSPKLVTLNNHEAQLQVGDQVPITTQSSVSTANSDAPIVNSVAMRDTGVILQVTPRVNKNGLVQLDISQELSNSIPTTTSSIDSPTIQERRFSTTVVVNNGDTVALGGLITESVTKGRSGVPYLSRIPGLGALFGNTDDTTTRTELILLITPRVMRDDTEFQAVMDDLKNEFRSLRKVFKEPAPAKP